MLSDDELPLIKAIRSELFPLDRLDPGSDLLEFLSKILVTDFSDEVLSPGPGGRFDIGLSFVDEAVINLVGLEGFAIVFGGASQSLITFGMTWTPTTWEVRLGAGARLRFPRNILKPVRRDGDAWVDDPSREFSEIEVAAGIIIDQDWNVSFDGSNAFGLEPSMVADSGLVVEGQIALDLSETTGLPESAALGLPPTWRGVIFKSLKVYMPDAVTQAVPIESLGLTNFHIGTGGVTGTITLTGTPGDGTIGGFPFRPTSLAVELRQNCLVRAEIEGRLTLSFFDGPLDVKAGFDLDGNFTVGLSAASGLYTLEKPGILSLAVDGITFSLQDGVFKVGIAGTITPRLGEPQLEWPGFTVQELSIDSEGRVRLEGGWINLPSQYSLSFYGFTVSITRLGMGKHDDGGKWIGFSGGIKLVDGLSLGGSVDGLTVTWYDDGRTPKITLDGVGVELEIPEVLRFKGSVSYHELPGQRRFDGDISLELMAIGLRIDGKIVIGVDTNIATGEEYAFFALYIAVQLPAGIPLWATGLGLFGIAGLVAIQMAPNKGAAPNVLHPSSRPDEEWFENTDGSPGWFKRDPIGVTDLRSKWDPIKDGFAIGGGVTIGTMADNGFTFAGSVLLVISFPGPVILIEGKANLLKERSSLTDDPLFRALVVLDFRAGNFLVGLMAKYKYGDGGEVIDISGSAEAFFDFNDASRWHIYLGVKDPKIRRIRALIISIFEANAYFMIDPTALQMGAWVGYDKQWNFGPVSVVVEAWIEGGATVSWKPVHFYGYLWLHGKAELRVFGFGLGMHVDARVAADAFDPFHVIAEFSVGIDLPWPLSDFNVDITLEWGPTPNQPPLPLPLKEVAVEHFKATASWPLPRTQLLLPDTDDGTGMLRVPVPVANLGAAPPALAPVVPVDARPHITFGRAVHDDAFIGVNPQPVWPSANPIGWERIGDPASNQGPMRVRFSLREVAIAKWSGSAWIDVARKGTSGNAASIKELYGSWAPMPLLPAGLAAPGSDPPVAQVKLWLWSRTPFDFSRHGGRAWDEWFTDTFMTYPCIPPVTSRTVCCDFDDIPVGSTIVLPMPCIRHREIVFVGTAPGIVERLPGPSHGHTQALCWAPAPRPQRPPPPAAGVPAIRRPIERPPTVTPVPATFGIMLQGDAADSMTLVFAAPAAGTVRRCFTVGDVTGDKAIFPLTLGGLTARIFGWDGKEVPEAAIVQVGTERGFNFVRAAEVTLPCAASAVDVVVRQFATPVMVTGYDAGGRIVDQERAPSVRDRVVVRLEGPGITRIVIEAPQNEAFLIQVCAECPASAPLDVRVFAVDDRGARTGPYLPAGDTVTVAVQGLRAVSVYSRAHVCLIEVCVTFAPSADEVAARQDMAQRLSDSMALWGSEGEVFEPNASYRLKIVTRVQAVGEDALAGISHNHDITELGYFKTQGPPGLTALSPPIHHPPGEAFDSGLDDLVRYVRQTVPPTVPARGQLPVLPRPVYRAYDVGVEFNEPYVDLMYRLAKRDLYLYLFDVNNRPARDVAGRVIVAANRWGTTESLVLSESEMRYLTVIDRATCVAADPVIIPKQQTLFAIDSGLVLAADTVHQARLIPLLFHDDFRDGLAAWTIVDMGTNQAPSAWTTLGHPTLEGAGATAAGVVVTLTGAADLSRLDVATDVVVLSTDTARPSKTYRVLAVDQAAKNVTVDGAPALATGASAWRVPGWGAVRQASNIWGGDEVASSVPKPGTLLVAGDVAWTDYRLTVQVRAGDDDGMGVVFRYRGTSEHYRFSMDRERRFRRLVRVSGGTYTVLAEDEFAYATNQDYVITVEAVDTSIRVYLDGLLVFDATDEALPDGRVGLYSWANQGVRFADVRVDDLSEQAPIAFNFSFTTSNYADFFHHLHGFDDRCWITEAGDGNLAAEIAAAVASGTAVSDAETRAFQSFASKVLGSAARNMPESVEVHRVTVGNVPTGFLIRSPEPLDWKRTSIALSSAAGLVEEPAIPGVAKITDVATGPSPNDETITVLARDATTFAGASLETYDVPSPLADVLPDVLLEDTFEQPGGLLLDQVFGTNALDAFTIVDADGAIQGPSQWAVSSGGIAQTSNIFAGPLTGTDPARLGTVAVTGGRWTDLRLTATLRSGDNDAIGLVVRYHDDLNWYRFSMDRQRAYRRLVKSVNGVISVLWEDTIAYDQGRAYEVRIDVYRDLLIGYIDRELVFVVRDPDVAEGQVGFYAWANTTARFESLRVEALDSPPLIAEAPLTDLAQLTIVDSGTVAAPSSWTAASGIATQTSAIGGDVPPLGIAQPGTVALLEPSLSDFELSAILTSTDGAIGVVFRYQDANNWYRFSMDRQQPSRRLVRCVAGVHTILWQDGVAYQADRAYGITITAEGPRLRGRIGGAPLFDIVDAAHQRGRIGLYSWNNTSARFTKVVVGNPVRRIGAWDIADHPSLSGSSAWRTTSGALRQHSPIGGASLPAAPGTIALAGQSGWADYRLDVRAGSDVAGALGVVFRYRDADNWYRLSFDAQRGYRRFAKCTGGVVTVLWEDAQSYVVGRPFSLIVDAIGPRLVAQHDGEQLFVVIDNDHASGRIGLYTSANTGARFERVSLTLPPLDAYAVLRDRFASAGLTGWTIVDEGPENAPSAWAVANGELRQTSNIFSNPTDAASIEKRGTQAIAGNAAWTDVVLSARVRSDDDDAVGVLFRYQDANNFYRFSMDRQRRYRRIVRAAAGVFTTLWEDATPFDAGRAYDLLVAVVGVRITMWLDGIPVAELEDAAVPAGRIGLYCWGNAGASFSRVRVFAPAQLAPPDLLSEDFERPLLDRWTFVTTGTQELPAAWTMTAGALRQSSNVWGGQTNPAELLKPGTAAIYTQAAGLGPEGIVPGSESWSDYRVTVRLRSDDNDAIGVFVRYRDEDNWYRFSMDRQRAYRRLVRCDAGVVTLLWQDAVAYAVGREYLVTLDVVGDSIAGYIDGEAIFSVRDRTHVRGTIGLYSWGNVGARFSSVRVTAAAWSTHYRFGLDESLLPPGTRIVVHSGNAADWNQPPVPGVTHRFAAPSLDRGRRKLPVNRSADLRWRDRLGEPGHARRFLLSSSYAAIANVRLLRKADGTEAALFVPSLTEGQYRLSLIYRRDNTAADPDSTVLSRGGDQSDELVTLDVPWTP